jgi:hypothetical protein
MLELWTRLKATVSSWSKKIFSSALGFVGGMIAWFATNYWGRSLLRFWDLRLEAHETIYLYANVRADRPSDLARAQEASNHFRKLGAKIDGLRTVLPAPLSWYLRARRYHLQLAAEGLTGLSNWLGVDDDKTSQFRVLAQKNLRLPIDPEERESVEREQRLSDVPI